MVLAQIAMGTQSSEIIVVPELLEMPSLRARFHYERGSGQKDKTPITIVHIS